MENAPNSAGKPKNVLWMARSSRRVHGHDARKNQHPDYDSGYGEEYSRQQNADALTTLQTIGL